MASKMVNDLKPKRKDGNVGLKMDIFLKILTRLAGVCLEGFRRFDFSQRWCSWIYTILSLARISILLNGCPEGFFKINRGLRQGNMKSLDNILAFPGKYQSSSGQTVCRQTSKVYYGGGSLSRCRTITNLLGMEVSTFPDRYLGVQIMPGAIKYRHISNVIDKIKKQISVLLGVVLINFVIDSYAIHNMVVYKWPRKFILQCERVIRNFIWSGDSEVARKLVIGYDKVCYPVKEGGLGITSIRMAHTILDTNTKVLLRDGRSISLYFDAWYANESIADTLGVLG
ncbi:uncharacterized protein LOC113345754 [Papaver somniferum]|uniref:uncharacterized protein LOC113345754 n=1 Tax=Papaver somniferum TaxID=3469 RepID=UPI000E6F5801|nr:uncharacterized protein LOC113345754 [Papaver somniferum]